ncbi:unnamed protein product, partial [Didymodactylos carnosus]
TSSPSVPCETNSGLPTKMSINFVTNSRKKRSFHKRELFDAIDELNHILGVMNQTSMTTTSVPSQSLKLEHGFIDRLQKIVNISSQLTTTTETTTTTDVMPHVDDRFDQLLGTTITTSPTRVFNSSSPTTIGFHVSRVDDMLRLTVEPSYEQQPFLKDSIDREFRSEKQSQYPPSLRSLPVTLGRQLDISCLSGIRRKALLPQITITIGTQDLQNVNSHDQLIDNSKHLYQRIVIAHLKIHQGHNQQTIACRSIDINNNNDDNSDNDEIMMVQPFYFNVKQPIQCKSAVWLMFINIEKKISCPIEQSNDSTIKYKWKAPDGSRALVGKQIDSQFLNYRIPSDRDFGDLICETQSVTGDKQECIVRLLSTEQYLKNLIVMSPYGGVPLVIFLILFYCCTVGYLQKRKQKMTSQTTNAPVQSSLEPSKLRDKKLLPHDDEEFIAVDEIITVVPATHDATQQTHNALRKTSDGGKGHGQLFANTQERSQKYLHQQPTLMLSSAYNNSWPDVNQDEIVVEEINPYRFYSTEQDYLLQSLQSNEPLTKKTTAAMNKKKHFYVKRSLLKNLFPTTAFSRQAFNRNASTGTGKKHHRHHSSRKINKNIH